MNLVVNWFSVATHLLSCQLRSTLVIRNNDDTSVPTHLLGDSALHVSKESDDNFLFLDLSLKIRVKLDLHETYVLDFLLGTLIRDQDNAS